MPKAAVMKRQLSLMSFSTQDWQCQAWIKGANYSQLWRVLGIKQSYGSRYACMKRFIFYTFALVTSPQNCCHPPPLPVDEAPSRSQVDEPSTHCRLRSMPPPLLRPLTHWLMHFVQLHQRIFCSATPFAIGCIDSSVCRLFIHYVSKNRVPKTSWHSFVKIGPLWMICHRMHPHLIADWLRLKQTCAWA